VTTIALSTGTSNGLSFIRSGSASQVLFKDNTATDIVTLQNANGAALVFGTNAAEKMRIQSSGNVGIGTAAPSQLLDVSSTGGPLAAFSSSATSGGYVQWNRSGTAKGYIGIGGSIIVNGGVDNFSIRAESSLLFSSGGASERMRIDAAGNVGIGTASPAYPLTLGNNKQFGALNTGGSAVTLAILNGSNNLVFGDDSANTGNLTVQSRAETKFILNGAERMRISSAGTVSLGTTVDNPVGNRVDGIALFGSGAVRSRAPTGASYFGLNVTNGVNLYFYTDNGSAFVTGGHIATNGATTSYNASSDYRLKNNIQPLTDALSRVALLRPVKWIWKEELGGTDPNGEGFVAHELAEILPMAVTGEKDELDEDGKPKYQGVDTRFLVATLTAAMQEQQATIEALTARITALEG
jgi:hypothetical protein